VVEAVNGQQALNILVSRFEQRIDLIIVDLQMPVMDGWHFIGLLQCYVRLSTIPVIVVAAATDPQLERITHRAVLGCVRAPYELDTLMSMVEECINPATATGSGDAHG
jgi:CheY-like chemotaxis protein